uniref:Uncharacterized protein n=1 Tax=Panagrolaimus sp. ES5 TaxID=591445 RepID=A0AC34G922_9BILA
MHYMAMNPPSAEVYQKLIQSCKYFFVKNSILVLSGLYYENSRWEALINGEWKNIDLSNNPNKLWITDTFYVYAKSDITVVSPIISKFFKCNAKELILWEQILSYNEFMIIAPALEHFSLNLVTVKYDDGTIVPFEKLVEQLPNAKEIDCLFSSDTEMITFKTSKELLKIPHFATLDLFHLSIIPEVFDIESFYVHIKKNKRTNIWLSYCDINSKEYKARLEEIIDEIIEANNHEYKTPLILFNWLDQKKNKKLFAIRNKQ